MLQASENRFQIRGIRHNRKAQLFHLLQPLGVPNTGDSQAIFAMTGIVPGDPHHLNKSWTGGAMWWSEWPDIYRMQVHDCFSLVLYG